MPFTFPEKLTNLDEAPEGFRGLYVPAGEGATGFVYHPEFVAHTSGLTSALGKERKANKDKQTLIDGWLALGEKPEDIKAKLEELTEAATKGNQGEQVWQKAKNEMEKGHAIALKKKDEEVETMRGSLKRHLIEREAATALAAAEGSVKLLMPHIKGMAKVVLEKDEYVVRIVDGDGDARMNSKGEFMSIGDLIGELKASAEFGPAFKASGNSGGGMPPGGSKKGGGGGTEANKDQSPVSKIERGLGNRK